MKNEPLILESLIARPVLSPLARPVIARIAKIDHWPLILIDLHTREGVTGRAYLEPHVPKSMKYLIQALKDLANLFKGRPIVPVDMYNFSRKSLHFSVTRALP